MKSLLILLCLFLYGTNPAPDNVLNRFKTPDGYTQDKPAPGSFGAWLQALPLKPVGTPTRTYKGDIAQTDVYTAAVVDMSVGNQDLQQCAFVVNTCTVKKNMMPLALNLKVVLSAIICIMLTATVIMIINGC